MHLALLPTRSLIIALLHFLPSVKLFPRKGGVFIKSVSLFAIKSTHESLAVNAPGAFIKPRQHPFDKLGAKKESYLWSIEPVCVLNTSGCLLLPTAIINFKLQLKWIEAQAEMKLQHSSNDVLRVFYFDILLFILLMVTQQQHVNLLDVHVNIFID